jgi:hypothetical protein
MKITTYAKNGLTKLEYFKTHLQILNPFLPVQLTPKRLEVLAAFMASEESERFGTTSRKLVRKQLGLTHGGLGNYLTYFKEEKFIYIPEGKEDYEIREWLFPAKDTQGYQFKISTHD